MSEATEAFDAWTNRYHQWNNYNNLDHEAEMQYQMFLAVLPSMILEPLAMEAEANNIDSTAIWDVKGSFDAIKNNETAFDLAMDKVWAIVRRLHVKSQFTDAIPKADEQVYIYLTKARTAQLYEKSATWLREELKKSPCPIPCKDVRIKSLWLLKSVHDMLERQLREKNPKA